MMYVRQIIMLYTLNLQSAVCQLYLNKTGRNKKVGVLVCFFVFLPLNRNQKDKQPKITLPPISINLI